MKIVQVIINNYRNLDGIIIDLNPDINFFVGENDLGKSNFLNMLDMIMNARKFQEDDFNDIKKPIKIEILIKLEDQEIGIFEDYFDPAREKTIRICAKQDEPEEFIRYYHKETEQEISYIKLRAVNFIKYDSLRTPKEELTFYKNKGVGKFLGFLIDRIVNSEEPGAQKEYLNKENVGEIIKSINENFEKIRMFKEYKINASLEGSIKELIYKIIKIKDSKGFDIQQTGYGVQFSVLIILSILERLMALIESRKHEDYIFTNGEIKSVSLVLGLDEPEIHLHPYMQRSVVKYINRLLNNKETEFKALVKELFGVDNIIGQALIVSHSPSILLDNYKYIVRFYSEGKIIKAVSGEKLEMGQDIEKHLLMNFPYIKEALFSKCVIIVEGHTECGALPLWVIKILGDIDEYGISVIQAGGGKSIKPIVDLLNQLKIPNVSIVDKDIFENDKEYYESINNLFVTKGQDFEHDLVQQLMSSGNESILFDLVSEFSKEKLEYTVYSQKLEKIADKYNIQITWDKKDYKFSELSGNLDRELIEVMFLSWLDIRKSSILGRFIGDKINQEHIPQVYCNAIEAAKNEVK